MEIPFGGIPVVCVFLGDVLVTIADEKTHLKELHEVLTRTKDHELFQAVQQAVPKKGVNFERFCDY